MPLYTYQCVSCQNQFDIRHSYKETNISCIECGHKDLKKVMTPVNYRKNTQPSMKRNEKTGTLVRQAIAENAEETKAYKQELLKKAAAGKK